MSRRPTNLYRLQLNPTFTLCDALAVLPYLKELGIDTLYCSPLLQSAEGSMHSYDLINPLKFNQQIGGEKAFLAFCVLAKSLEFNIVLDVVVNHMAASLENPWWYDLLESGPYSEYAEYFDIDFQPLLSSLKGKVLMPILDRPFHQALDESQITLASLKSGLAIEVMGLSFPVSTQGYLECLEAIDALTIHLEIKALYKEFKKLILMTSFKEKEKRGVVFKSLKDSWALLAQNKEIKSLIDQYIREINQDKSRLENFLSKQHFFLEFWQYANQNINYRRFFDIHSLAAIRMENKDVFDHFHPLIGQLLKDKSIQGLRIDHPDGLYNPYQYLKHLQKLYKKLDPSAEKSLYLVVEKILEKGERLPLHWPVKGTVGYEYLNLLHQVFIDKGQEENFSELYEVFLGEKIDKELLLQKEKREFALLYMTSDMKALANKFFNCADLRNIEDLSIEHLEEALIELYVFFPVYRTYLDQEIGVLTAFEKAILVKVFDKAQKNKPFLTSSFNYLKGLFLEGFEALNSSEIACVMKFQQLSPVIMAKGLEDTHLYNYNRFIALNEVGGEPHGFGESIQDFHSEMEFKQTHHPDGWMTFSTHDTKRSFDMRMRLCVLSEVFDEWKELVVSWKRQNACYKIHVEKELFPDFNREYFLYQTLVGFWPRDVQNKQALVERLKSYLIKASRESKVYTTWIHHHPSYEKALLHFIEAILQEDTPFYKSLLQFVSKIDRPGQLSSLSCINLTLGLPAPLDIYQGTEKWDFSLVDPDNRRPVDYKNRKIALARIQSIVSCKQWIANAFNQEDLEPLKLYLLYRGLHVRREKGEFFLTAKYIPIKCKGQKYHHVLAYLRQEGEFCALIVSSRFLTGYDNAFFWQDTYLSSPQELIGKSLTNIYTQEILQFQEKMLLQILLEVAPFGLWIF